MMHSRADDMIDLLIYSMRGFKEPTFKDLWLEHVDFAKREFKIVNRGTGDEEIHFNVQIPIVRPIEWITLDTRNF